MADRLIAPAHSEPPRPILFLDVDGVVAPLGKHPDRELRRIWGLEVPIVPEFESILSTLANTFEIVWCTDWEENANLVGEVYGLAPLPHVPITRQPDGATPSYELLNDRGEYIYEVHRLTHWLDLDEERGRESPSMWHKVPSVAAYLDKHATPDRPFAWIDDHINYEARLLAESWTAETSLIRARREVGLTSEMVTVLEDFADRVAESGSEDPLGDSKRI
jgi:hypothetical protein